MFELTELSDPLGLVRWANPMGNYNPLRLVRWAGRMGNRQSSSPEVR